MGCLYDWLMSIEIGDERHILGMLRIDSNLAKSFTIITKIQISRYFFDISGLLENCFCQLPLVIIRQNDADSGLPFRGIENIVIVRNDKIRT